MALESRTLLSAIQFNDEIGVGRLASIVSLADVNGDQRQDVLLARSSTIRLFLNNGNAVLQTARDFSTVAGVAVSAFACGDLNRDGNVDIVTGNGNGGGSILLGMGDGTFQSSQRIGSGVELLAVTIADVNRDSKLDLVFAGGSGAKIFLGNGDGTFATALSYVVGSSPSAVAVADFNSDGNPDIVTANTGTTSSYGNTLSILLGRGDGTFAPQQLIQVATQPSSIQIRNLNDDAISDVVVICNGTICILMGKGDGTFGPRHDVYAGGPGRSVASADLDHDDTWDLVAVNADKPGNVSVFLGSGDGTFAAPSVYPTGVVPVSVAVGDMDGDGIPDVVTANGAGTVNILRNTGDGTFPVAPVIPGGDTAESMATGDFDRDGIPDVVVANHLAAGSVSVLLGCAGASFQNERTYPVGKYPIFVGVADLNDDSNPDIFVSSYVAGTVGVLLGNGDGTFQSQRPSYAGAIPAGFAVGDLNGDKKVDLVSANWGSGIVSILLGAGDGTFGMCAELPLPDGHYPNCISLTDLNSDGRSDIVVSCANVHWIDVMLGDGGWSFQSPQSYATRDPAYSLVVADLNSDHHPDIATADSAGFVGVFVGNGDGTFKPEALVTDSGSPTQILVADINRDGKADLVTANYGSASSLASVLPGNGDGTFSGLYQFAIGPEVQAIGMADMDGDGKLDIIAANASSPGSLRVLLNRTAGLIAVGSFSYLKSQKIQLAFGDSIGTSLSLNDLVWTNQATGQVWPSTGLSLSVGTDGRTASITVIGNLLPDGNYRLRLPATNVQDANALPMDNDLVLDFFVLSGDANHDRVVDVTDLGILATNWQGTGKTFGQGDFNYDGVVDVSDLVILATDWQKTITVPAAGARSALQSLGSFADAATPGQAVVFGSRKRRLFDDALASSASGLI